MSEGLGIQVDGNHYTRMKIQPVELAYRLYGTPCFCKLSKYLTRDKGDKLTNLKKALHCIQLEKDLFKYADNYLDRLDGFVSYEEVQKLLIEFTDNEMYRDALIKMWIGDYYGAIDTLEDIIHQYKVNNQ